MSPGRRIGGGGGGGGGSDQESVRRTQTGDALSYSQQVMENAMAAVSPDAESSLHPPPSTIQGLASGDQVGGWWAAVVAVASYWLLCEEDKADQLHARIEACPKADHDDPLLEAVLSAYRYNYSIVLSNLSEMFNCQYSSASLTCCLRARRLLLRGADSKTVLQQCAWAGCRLKESLHVSVHKNPQPMVQVKISGPYNPG